VNDTDARLWHPWLRIHRLLRAMPHERWSAEAWPKVKAEFKKALALRSQIRRAGWFQLTWLAAALRILSLRDGHDQTRTLDSER
jgi:hypothetical protein